MKTIIAGSRHIASGRAEALVLEALEKCPWTHEITEIIHGAAQGIDAAADRVCRGRWKVTPDPADWEKHGKPAGAIRNQRMALGSQALIAIWDGQSPGTKNMIKTARGYGLRVYVHRFAPGGGPAPAPASRGFGVG